MILSIVLLDFTNLIIVCGKSAFKHAAILPCLLPSCLLCLIIVVVNWDIFVLTSNSGRESDLQEALFEKYLHCSWAHNNFQWRNPLILSVIEMSTERVLLNSVLHPVQWLPCQMQRWNLNQSRENWHKKFEWSQTPKSHGRDQSPSFCQASTPGAESSTERAVVET